MKLSLKIILAFLSSIAVTLILILILLWSRPTILINESNLQRVLQYVPAIQQYSWDHLQVKTNKEGWSKRKLSISAQNLCTYLKVKSSTIDSCIHKLDFDLMLFLNLTRPVSFSGPLKLEMSFIEIDLGESSIDNDDKGPLEQPLNLNDYWAQVWNQDIPELDLKFNSIQVKGLKGSTYKEIFPLELTLNKTKENLHLNTLGVELQATPDKIQAEALRWELPHRLAVNLPPISKIKISTAIEEDVWATKLLIESLGLKANLNLDLPAIIPQDEKKQQAFLNSVLKNLSLNAHAKDISQILTYLKDYYQRPQLNELTKDLSGSVQMSTKFESTNENDLTFSLDVKIPLKHQGQLVDISLKNKTKIGNESELDVNRIKQLAILGTTAHVRLHAFKDHLSKNVQTKLSQFPAPFNKLNGVLNIDLSFMSYQKQQVLAKIIGDVDLSHKEQRLKINLKNTSLLDIQTFKVSQNRAEVNLKEIKIHLPEVTATQALPSLGPDTRIKSVKEIRKAKTQQKQTTPFDISLKTPLNSPLEISTNLLDQIVKLAVDLKVNQQAIQSGSVSVLPFKTEFFRRKIGIENFVINFKAPLLPTIDALFIFPLPEYKISLKLVGPLESPTPLLSSDPPLAEDDIYSVLLFGRPMSELPADQQASASQKSSRLFSQGLLSLSVLYLFADTPIQSIGLDPGTKEVSAQIALGNRNSLRISEREGEEQTLGVRRSLGKGWFIDTSMQKSSEDQTSESQYGVLIERMISY